MVFILARTFLACLPLRAGVWVLALVGLLLGVAGAVCGWMEVVLLGELRHSHCRVVC